MTRKTLPEMPVGMERIYRRFERWRKSHRGRLPIPAALWAAATAVAREHGVFPDRQDLASGTWQAEAHGGIVQACRQAGRRAGRLLGVDCAPGSGLRARSDGVRHRGGRAARQDAHPVERRPRPARISPDPEPGTVGSRSVIQIAPQIRILVAVDAIDCRKGIDAHRPAMPGETERRSVFRLPVHFPVPEWSGHQNLAVRWPRVLAGDEALVQRTVQVVADRR